MSSLLNCFEITEAERKLLINSNPGKMTSHGNEKLVDSQPLENNKGNSFKPKEYVRNKPSFGSRPTGKVKFWDPTSSKQAHARIPEVTTSVTRRIKPLKNLDNVDSDLGKITSCGKDRLVASRSLENNKRKRFGPSDSATNKSFCMRPIITDVSWKEQVKREKIREGMIMFDQVNEKLYQDNKLKPKGKKIADWRVPQEAAKIVKGKLKWMDPEKILGPICGVQIGDKFKYRAQLQMVGLHCQPHSGIDYTKIEGKNLAISIVDSHRYANESGCCDMLIYCGQGGLGFMGAKLPAEDQKLERGNLALRNSMVEKTPVRVIRKVQGAGKGEFYVYDGLYIVKHCTQRSEEGKTVFKFQLDRVPGQPDLLRMLHASR